LLILLVKNQRAIKLAETESASKKIVVNRFTFLLEVVFVFVGVGLYSYGARLVLPFFISIDSVLFGPIFFLIRALGILIIVPLFLVISNFLLESQRKELIIEEDISPFMGHMKQYNIKKTNAKFQLLYGILILFLFFIPLDFFSYLLIPDFIEFQANALTGSSSTLNIYFFEPYLNFLLFVIILQFSVAIYEETISRGFLTKRGGENFNVISAIIISSVYFGFMHFGYISEDYAILYPMVFFIEAFTVGVILSLFIIKKKWIFPVIFAHGLNNIISAHTIWSYLQGTDFSIVAISLYLPLLIISILLVIWQFPRIKASISTGVKELKTYFNTDNKIREYRSDIYIRILIDILIGFIIFILGLFVFQV